MHRDPWHPVRGMLPGESSSAIRAAAAVISAGGCQRSSQHSRLQAVGPSALGCAAPDPSIPQIVPWQCSIGDCSTEIDYSGIGNSKGWAVEKIGQLFRARVRAREDIGLSGFMLPTTRALSMRVPTKMVPAPAEPLTKG